jgi:hypothetical protein
VSIDLDADVGTVLKLYGATMLQVQGLEYILAGVAAAIRYKPKPPRPMSPERMTAIVAKDFNRRWHGYRKASAWEHLRGDGDGTLNWAYAVRADA